MHDLREIRDTRGFARAAQADQGLYTLLRSIKVKNLAEDLFGGCQLDAVETKG